MLNDYLNAAHVKPFLYVYITHLFGATSYLSFKSQLRYQLLQKSSLPLLLSVCHSTLYLPLAISLPHGYCVTVIVF